LLPVIRSFSGPPLTALLSLLERLEEITFSALNTGGSQAVNPPISAGALTRTEIVEPLLDELLADALLLDDVAPGVNIVWLSLTVTPLMVVEALLLPPAPVPSTAELELLELLELFNGSNQSCNPFNKSDILLSNAYNSSSLCFQTHSLVLTCLFSKFFKTFNLKGKNKMRES
jgi:hypothetical protein